MKKVNLSSSQEMRDYLRAREQFASATLPMEAGQGGIASKLFCPQELSAGVLCESGIAALLKQFDESQKEGSADINGFAFKYLELYEKGSTDTKHCYSCGLWTYQKLDGPCTDPGCYGTLASPIVQHSSECFMMRYSDPDIWELRRVTRTVLAFDNLVNACNDIFVQLQSRDTHEFSVTAGSDDH